MINSFLEVLEISLSVDSSFLTAFKYIGAGSAIGIGLIFGSLIIAFVRNPQQNGPIFNYAMFGFALTEAIALFGLMMAFLILFA